jgi:ABC-type dipeptide/oligopeptide/nickel transport system permease component
MAIAFLYAIAIVVFNTIADLLYAVLDPRVSRRPPAA